LVVGDDDGEYSAGGLDINEDRGAGSLTTNSTGRRDRWRWLAAIVGAAVLLLDGAIAEAQQDRRTTTVAGRARPEVDAIGIRVGSLIVLPSVTVSESYDDNIFAANDGEIDDLITDIEPEIIVKSDWNRHALKIVAQADVGRHNDNTKEDYEDVKFSGRLRVDAFSDTYLIGDGGYAMRHAERSSPDDTGGTEPTQFVVMNTEVSAYHRRNRFSLSLTGRRTVTDYDDTPTDAGVDINHDDRDRERYDVVARGGYEIVPEYQGFVQVAANLNDYDLSLDDNGVNRDSKGLRVDVGTRIDLSGVTFGDVFVGYIVQNYDDGQLATIDGVALGADLTWNVTRLTTVKLGIDRQVKETTQGLASGYFDSSVDVSLDHELLRSLIVSLGGNFTQSQYKGIDRDDDTLQLSLGVKYMLSRYVQLMLDYDFTRRISNVEGSGFDNNVIALRLKGQF
jgi:hypothetical protein